MSKMATEELTGKIIGCAMKVHRALGSGFLESVYQNALAYELQQAGLKVDCEVSTLPYKKKFRVYRKPDSNPVHPEKSCESCLT